MREACRKLRALYLPLIRRRKAQRMQDFLNAVERHTSTTPAQSAGCSYKRRVRDGLRNQTNDRQDYRRCKVG
jgi:hypothetical protein